MELFQIIKKKVDFQTYILLDCTHTFLTILCWEKPNHVSITGQREIKKHTQTHARINNQGMGRVETEDLC